MIVHKDKGSNLGVAGYFVWNGGGWRDSVSSTRIESALNGYLAKCGKVNRKGLRKHRMGLALNPHCTCRPKVHERQITTGSRTRKFQGRTLYLYQFLWKMSSKTHVGRTLEHKAGTLQKMLICIFPVKDRKGVWLFMSFQDSSYQLGGHRILGEGLIKRKFQVPMPSLSDERHNATAKCQITLFMSQNNELSRTGLM